MKISTVDMTINDIVLMDFDQTLRHKACLEPCVQHPSGSFLVSIIVPKIFGIYCSDGRQSHGPFVI